MELKGLYNEEILMELLDEGKIDRLEYYLHHEKLKTEFEDWCSQHGYTTLTPSTADEFFRHQLAQEEQDHEEAE